MRKQKNIIKTILMTICTISILISIFNIFFCSITVISAQTFFYAVIDLRNSFMHFLHIHFTFFELNKLKLINFYFKTHSADLIVHQKLIQHKKNLIETFWISFYSFRPTDLDLFLFISQTILIQMHFICEMNTLN